MEAFLQKHHIQEKVFAVGVSGGADSLALALMLAEELPVFGRRIVALTVDHGLRPISAQEAQYVHELMEQRGIEHHILLWQGEKPQTGIEDAARQMRYTLMASWCKEHQIKCLFVAHHAQDQAETFLMRLQRGSGLEGLCAMRAVSDWNGLKILRPLLDMPPQKMRVYLQQKNVSWVEDESNSNRHYLRNRIRAFLPILQKETGITTAKIFHAVQNLQSAEDYIECQTEALFATQVKQYAINVFGFKHSEFLCWHPEMQFRILARLSRQNYIARAERILRLAEKLRHLPFKAATLGQKEFLLKDGIVFVVPEDRRKIKFAAKEWKEFVAENQQYRNMKLPYKVRREILKNRSKDDL